MGLGSKVKQTFLSGGPSEYQHSCGEGRNIHRCRNIWATTSPSIRDGRASTEIVDWELDQRDADRDRSVRVGAGKSGNEEDFEGDQNARADHSDVRGDRVSWRNEEN